MRFSRLATVCDTTVRDEQIPGPRWPCWLWWMDGSTGFSEAHKEHVHTEADALPRWCTAHKGLADAPHFRQTGGCRCVTVNMVAFRGKRCTIIPCVVCRAGEGISHTRCRSKDKCNDIEGSIGEGKCSNSQFSILRYLGHCICLIVVPDMDTPGIAGGLSLDRCGHGSLCVCVGVCVVGWWLTEGKKQRKAISSQSAIFLVCFQLEREIVHDTNSFL